MTRGLIALVERAATWKGLLLSFALFVAMTTVVLIQVHEFEELTGGVPLIEVTSTLDQSLYDVAARYPDDAHDLYSTVIQPLDILLPVTVGLFLSIALAFLTRRLFDEQSRWRALPILGVFAALMDWLENVGVFVILRTGEDPLTFVDAATRVATAIKTGVGGVCLASVVVLLIAVLVGGSGRHRQRQHHEQPSSQSVGDNRLSIPGRRPCLNHPIL